MATTDVFTNSINSLLHGAENNVFKGYWTYDIDFDDPTWLKWAVTRYTVSSGLTTDSQCQVYIKYSKDRLSWTNWMLMPNSPQNSENPYVINDLIYGMKFKIVLSDGWDGTVSVPPVVQLLRYYTVAPSKTYIISPAFSNTGMIFEYILSATANLPKTARIRWGIVRGNSTDFADFETAINGKIGVLPNRQSGIRYTPKVIRGNLTTQTSNNQTYQVLEKNNSNAAWNDTDIVYVSINGKLVDPKRPTYSLDGKTGKIYFTSALLQKSTVVVTIITPEELISFDGEPTFTRDYRTYYASNGKWTKDATVIVLVNGQIARGGYWLSPDEGVVTFEYEKNSTDIVSIFIQYAPYFRIGAEITNYDEVNPVTMDNVGLYFTELSNSDLIGRYNRAPKPAIIENSLKLLCNANSLYSRMMVEYTFCSIEGSKEAGSTIEWERTRGASVVTLDGSNGIVNYNNRITQPMNDVYSSGDNSGKPFLAGDKVRVKVTPSDGINTGVPVWSDYVTLQDTKIPSVWDATISCNGVSEFKNVIVDSNGYLTTSVIHQFEQNEKIGFVGTNIPTALKPNTVYYVILDSSNTTDSGKRFYVSAQKDGARIVLTQTNSPFSVYTFQAYVPTGASLKADYKYHNPDNPTDTTDINNTCAVIWYLDDNTTTPYYTGRIIPQNTTESGQSLTYTVQPTNGYKVSSSSVIVQ